MWHIGSGARRAARPTDGQVRSCCRTDVSRNMRELAAFSFLLASGRPAAVGLRFIVSVGSRARHAIERENDGWNATGAGPAAGRQKYTMNERRLLTARSSSTWPDGQIIHNSNWSLPQTVESTTAGCFPAAFLSATASDISQAYGRCNRDLVYVIVVDEVTSHRRKWKQL